MGFLDTLDNMYTNSKSIIINDSQIIGTESDGSSDNYWISYNNTVYLMKDCSFNKSRKQPSYAPYCEYIASQFISKLGYNVHETELAIWNNKHVVLCKNLFNDYVVFKSFRDISEYSIDTNLENKFYTYDDVEYILSNLNPNMLLDFWDMFILDSIIGNRDRHAGNWGYIKDDNNIYMSPLYDQGHSLFPDVNLSDWVDTDFIKKRVFEIPGSQFKMWKENILDRPMRTNFYEVIQQCHSNQLFLNNSTK